jgi:hypothetical protein
MEKKLIEIFFNFIITNLQNIEESQISLAYPFTTDVKAIASKYSPWFRPVYFNDFKIREGFQTDLFELEQQPNIASEYSPYSSTYEQPMGKKAPYSMIQNTKLDVSKEAKEEAYNNALFRKEHCSSNHELIYKNSMVKPFAAEFVFPELKIEGTQHGHPCNPCSPSCNIHISKIDKRLDMENILHQRNLPFLEQTIPDWTADKYDMSIPNPIFQKYGNSYLSSQHFVEPANKMIVF